MEIEKSPLYRDAVDIMNSNEFSSVYGWSVTIHIGTDVYVPFKVMAVNVFKDYVNNFSDETTCTLMMPLGKYSRLIYPNRAALEMTLSKVPLNAINGRLSTDKVAQTERYSAILIDKGQAVVEGQGKEALDEDTLDLSMMISVDFQLINKSVEQLRMISIGGIYRKTGISNLLLGVLSNASMNIKIDDKRIMSGVDLIDPDNKEIKEQVVVTQGLRLVDFPKYIQRHYGVYNSDIGSYIQNDHWYVYPLYDTRQFNKRIKTLTVLILPKNKFTQIENTYRQISDSITILITSDTGFKDDSGTEYLNHGNGARFTNANEFLNKNDIKNNKVVVSRTKNNSEFVFDDRFDKLNNITTVNDRITANSFSIYSNLIKRNGGTFKMAWENCDQTLIIPGMSTRVIYFDEGKVHELYGVVQKLRAVSHSAGDVNSVKHQSHCVITLFINKAPASSD